MVSNQTFVKATALLEANYGVEYKPEKMQLLFDMIRDERWSEEKFKRTLKWFIKNKPFPAWTIADWFSFGIKVYPYEWYLKELEKNGASVNQSVERYLLDDGLTIVYRYKDGEEIPLKKFERGKIEKTFKEVEIHSWVR